VSEERDRVPEPGTARSTYDLRVVPLALRAKWLVFLHFAFTDPRWGEDVTATATYKRARVEIVHKQTGTVLVSWEESGEHAHELAVGIFRDLNLLSTPEFESEWNIAPPSSS